MYRNIILDGPNNLQVRRNGLCDDHSFVGGDSWHHRKSSQKLGRWDMRHDQSVFEKLFKQISCYRNTLIFIIRVFCSTRKTWSPLLHEEDISQITNEIFRTIRIGWPTRHYNVWCASTFRSSKDLYQELKSGCKAINCRNYQQAKASERKKEQRRQKRSPERNKVDHWFIIDGRGQKRKIWRRSVWFMGSKQQ